MFTVTVENWQAFWIVMLSGTALALALGIARSAKAGAPRPRIVAAAALLPLCAAFFSHLLYCVVSAEYVLDAYSIGYFFAFWERGHMLYGGMLGALLALLLVGGKDRTKLLEAFAPSLALMIVAARIGEGFLGQGYGEYGAPSELFCRFPFMVFDPDYEEWAWALFMLEALVALVLLVILLRRKPTWNGDGALLLCGLYACAQLVLESLRRDEYLRWGFVRVEELISAIVVLAVLLCYCLRAPKGRRLAKAICFAVYAAMIALCVLLEFATEGRISFLLFLSVDACYIAMTGACAVLCGCVLWMRRLCNARDTIDRKEAAYA